MYDDVCQAPPRTGGRLGDGGKCEVGCGRVGRGDHGGRKEEKKRGRGEGGGAGERGKRKKKALGEN